MELAELENIIKGYDKKINESIDLNRDVLKRILRNNPNKHMRIERLKALYQLWSPLLLPFLIAIIIEVMNIRISFTSNFYIGIGLFIPVFLFVWSLNIKHYLLIRKVNFSIPTILIKKQIAELERYCIWMTKIRNILMPLLIIGMLLIFVPQCTYYTEFIILVILAILVCIVSSFYRNHSIRERYKILKEEIEEIEALEK
jgi:hypothetical protein